MSSKITLAKLIAVFGTEDAAPITITRTGTKITAVRDDVVLSSKQIDDELAGANGEFKVTLAADGTFTSVATPAKATKSRQSPAFHSL